MRPTCHDIVRSLVLVLALGALAPSVGHARVSSRVQKVKRLYDQLFFDDAMKICRAVLDAGKNSRADLIELLRYKGLIAAVQNRPRDAGETFRKLLVVDPLAKLGGGHPPRVQRAFQRARRWFKRQKPLMVDVEAPGEVLRDGSTRITARVTSDPLGMVAHLVLHVRAQGHGDYRPHLTHHAQAASWTVAMDRIEGARRAARLEYYVAVLDGDYNELTLAGSTGAPRSIELSGPALPPPGQPPPVAGPAPAPGPKPSPAWYTRWWVWTAVGAVVVGTAVIAGVAASSPPDRVDAPVILEPAGTP